MVNEKKMEYNKLRDEYATLIFKSLRKHALAGNDYLPVWSYNISIRVAYKNIFGDDFKR